MDLAPGLTATQILNTDNTFIKVYHITGYLHKVQIFTNFMNGLTSQGRRKVFIAGQAKLNSEHTLIKCVGDR